MAKHPRKKQRLDFSSSISQKGTSHAGKLKNKSQKRKEKPLVQPLGSEATLARLLDEESKDDEERRLESILFGVPYVPTAKTSSSRHIADGGLVFDLDDENEEQQENEELERGGRPMAGLLDSDLFFVDDGLTQTSIDVPPIPGPSSSNSGSEIDSDEESPSEVEPESDSQSSSSSPPPTPRPSSPNLHSRIKKSAWTDTSTAPSRISLLSGPSRRRKLRHFVDEDEITEKDYESRLRAQFERINPEPSWAQRARKQNREQREIHGLVEDGERGSVDLDSVDIGSGEERKNLFTSTSGILKAAERRKKDSVVLPSGTLSIERLRDANQSTQDNGSGEVKVVSFHPSDKVPILCVGTADRRVRLYNVDGHTSPLIQTLHVPSLPLTSSTSALFHPSGSSILLSGPRPYFFTHDLQTGTTTKHERGLWGTTFASDQTSVDIGTKRSRGARSEGAESVHLTNFSPSGDILAVAAGKGAQVHFVDWNSGAGQVVGSVKCTLGGGRVTGMWWFDGSASSGVLGDVSLGARKHLAVLTSDAEVYLWDVGERKCVKRWKDEGGFRGAGRALAGTQSGNAHLALGSSSGFVNIYDSKSYSLYPSEVNNAPKPIKSIGNLTTAVSSLKFNHDAQLLAIASQEKKDSMRLIHVPTWTSFSNWPKQSTPLGIVTALDFSPKSQYIAIGNKRGRVLLYHLREYGAVGI